MADDPYEDWSVPATKPIIIGVVAALLLAATLIVASWLYDTTIRPRVQIRRQPFPTPQLETTQHERLHEPSPDRAAIDRAMASVAAQGDAAWNAVR